MPRDYQRGKCDDCGKRGRVWPFRLAYDGSTIKLCGKCQQVARNERRVVRKHKRWEDGPYR